MDIIENAKEFVQNNNKSLWAYHSTEHNFNVHKMFNHLCELSWIDKSSRLEWELSALFHDFNHTWRSDNIENEWWENLRNAIYWREEFANKEWLRSDIKTNYTNVHLWILCTGYQHRELVADRSKIFWPILRDADLLNNLRKPEYAIIRWKQLAEESNILRDKEFIQKNIEFYHNMSLYTNAGKIFFDKIKYDIIDILSDEIKKI